MADYGTIKVNKVTYKNGSDSDTDFNFKTDIVSSSDVALKAAKAGDTFTGDILIDNQKELRLGEPDGAGANYVGFEAPDTIASNVIWKLPNADGSANFLLKTDGSGNLGWAADSATDSTKLPLSGGTLTGNLSFEGATANDYETTLTVVDPTADRTITFPNATGTVTLGTIGTEIQAHDADTAKTDVDQEFTKPQRGNVTVATHSSGATYDFDLDVTNNFKLTISAAVELGFSNLDASREGQTGTIYVDNTGAVTPTWGDEVQFEGGSSGTISITQSAKSVLAYYVLPGGAKVLVKSILDVKDD